MDGEKTASPIAEEVLCAAPREEQDRAQSEAVLEDEDASQISFWPWMEEDVSGSLLSDYEIGALPWMDFSNLEHIGDHIPNRLLDGLHRTDDGADDTLGSAGTTNSNSILHSAVTSPSLGVPLSPFFQRIDFEVDDREEVESLFLGDTQRFLSMCDSRENNPWQSLIWPMAKDSQALYHAIAAMVFLRQSKSSSSMREQGLTHARKSTQQLAVDLNNGEVNIEAALAATLALGFAESWDSQELSTGRNHIQGASILLQQLITQNSSPKSSNEMSARLRLLANTWIYMDVLARLTSDCGPSSNTELLSLFLTDPIANSEKLDPLMGYATTLFPLIGRLADLITQIRFRNTRRNSPIIISRGIQLRHLIEAWTPAIDLEQINHPTTLQTEAIQLAEAYRSSTLLLLQEAVPELPSLASYAQLGQKSLMYLATIPPTSTTLIAHIFPLMVAATEAVDAEDREFVRDRWAIMEKQLATGVVQRCADVTEEVWRRRDEHFAGWLSSAAAARGSNAQSDFPISGAFRRGVDPVTRSGETDYTVKGRLHWIEVLKEWGWEGMCLDFRVPLYSTNANYHCQCYWAE